MSELKKALTVTDRATKGLNKATSELAKVAESLSTLTTGAEALAIDIEFKQSELDGISAKTATAEREAAADLKLRVRENEDKVLKTLLTSRGLADISVGDVNTLNQELNDALNGNEATTESAVKQAQSLLHAQYKGEQKTAEADHQVAVAQKDADLGAKDMQIGFMEKQIASLETTIEAERTARVNIAQADSQKQGVTVNTTSK